ncbi:hypothetical protein K470DRAFT_11881 [Piedraia hortae CBS 480.64]|uniref:AB hydrolase-1 domain-containing protein n=1 Tax=Piedraia hortae CBS 480.64 TaxID=1314780 RepID=A0A6A7BRC7_9PEZI|nr:hypothetical protein K470DRAFT_11881 [Piedraia hortae CBS 480.64]
MINQSRTELVLIRAVILLLSAIGPVCTAYTAVLALRGAITPQTKIQSCTHLQRKAIHPPLNSKLKRKEIFNNIKAELQDPRKFLSGWFRGANVEDIHREDLLDFLDWTFWEGRCGHDDSQELQAIADEVEELVGCKFKDGRGSAKGLRLTIDPIEMQPRSLVWYTIIMLLDTITHIRLLFHGMKYMWTPTTAFVVFPPRPLAFVTASGGSPADAMSYWYRPHAARDQLPIVYLHGIGIGLHQDVAFINDLTIALDHSSKDKVGILCVEMLPISNRLMSPMATRQRFVKQLTQVLNYHGWQRFVLASHSYGSVLTTHVLNDPQLAKRVSACLLIDPVTILLHTPSVAYNFTARRPREANEWQLWYFASQDPGVAHTLGRHFFWSENVLWRQRIQELVNDGMCMTFSLAGKDLIVDATAVRDCLMQGQVNESRLQVLWWDGLDHAQVFEDAASRTRLTETLVHYSRGC